MKKKYISPYLVIKQNTYDVILESVIDTEKQWFDFDGGYVDTEDNWL